MTRRPKKRKRIQIGLIVSADIKRRVIKAAKASGRSQSQEAEYLIERAILCNRIFELFNINPNDYMPRNTKIPTTGERR
jgi:hypothetical protein